ncbi:MAG: two-component system sensor histidine kinase CreC [Verrucomicrobiota bacterium]
MRLTLLLIGGLVFLVLFAVFRLSQDLERNVEQQYAQAAEEPMVDLAHLFASLVEAEMDQELGEIRTETLSELFDIAYRRDFSAQIYDLRKTELFTHVYITDRDGVVLFDSDGGAQEGADLSDSRDVFLTLRGSYGARSSRAREEDSRSSVFYVGAPIHHGESIIGMVSVSRPEEATMGSFIDQTRSQVRVQALRTASLVTICGILWTYLLLRPISKLSRHASAVTRGERTPLPEVGVWELRTLSRELETMREALEGKKYVEAYLQTFTHELKSPLSAIQGAAELLEDEKMPPEKRARFLGNIQQESERALDFVSGMLHLTSLESQAAVLEPTPVDLRAVILAERDHLRMTCQTKGVGWNMELPEEPHVADVPGDSFAIETAVRNLLSNAVDFSPEGGTVKVECSREWGGWKIVVEDEGPGIPEFARERVFERFYSLKHEVTGRKSSGLGLCFVREAAELHRGWVELGEADSGGTKATLWLPSDAV